MYSKEEIIENEEKIRNEIAEEALKWKGANYHHMAMLEYKAADCMTLLLQVYHKVGLIEQRDPEYYPPDFLFHRGTEDYLEGVSDYGYEVSTPKKGDIILYKFGRVISHSAIVTDYPTIIHAVAGNGIIIDDASQEYLKSHEKHIFSFWKE